jgi:predicted esterase
MAASDALSAPRTPRGRAPRSLGFLLSVVVLATGCAEGEDTPDWDMSPALVLDGGAPTGGGTAGGFTGAVSPAPSAGGATGIGGVGGTFGGTLSGGSTGSTGGAGSGTSLGGTAGTTGGAGATTAGLAGGLTAGGLTAGGLTAGGLTAGGILAGLGGGSAAGGILSGSGILGGAGGATGGGGTSTPLDPSVKQPDPSKLPMVNGACPDFRDGSTATVAGIRVKFWSGAAGKKGPLIFYWHGTGGSSDEAVGGLTGNGLGPVLNDIKAQGGIVASPDNSTGTGNSVDTVVWTTDDFKAADQIVACAIQAGRIDPGRIHALGFSAGGLMAGTMYYVRSNYMASVVTYSGGTSPWPGNSMAQDPSNKLPILLFHGGDGDWVILAFKDQSIQLATDAKAKGRFAVVCDHGGGHGIPSQGPSAAWTFFKAHPYNTVPEPWTTLPSGIPSYCKIF